MYIKDLIIKLSKEASLSDNELQNYVLHIQQILGECHMATKDFKKASLIFYQVCKLYNRWKVNNQTQLPEQDSNVTEFGVDDYIRSKASYAESLMNLGELKHAIEKFENAKKSIENEIVYENPMLFVNICNQLGNCYLNTDRL